MRWQHTIYAYPILLATAISLGHAAYALIRSRSHGQRPTLLLFAAMNVAIAIWTGFGALGLISTVPRFKYYAYVISHVGAAGVGPFLLLFVLAYTDRTKWLRPSIAVGVFVVPATFIALLVTNPYELALTETRIVEANGVLVFRATRGPAHMSLSFVYTLLLAIVILGVIGHETVRQGRRYLPQASLLTVAVVTPITVSALTIANVPPFTVDNVNFVSVSTAVSCIALGIATVRYRFLDLQPIANRTVVDHSPDGILVVDVDGRVVDANEAVSAMLDRDPIVGEAVDDLLPEARVTSDPGATTELELASDAVDFLVVRSRPLRRQGRHIGWVVVCSDVTEHRRRERELEAFTGVVSHDLRAPLRTTDRYLELLEDALDTELDDETRQLLAVARENSRRMQEMVSDLHRYSRIGATEDEFGSVDCEALVEAVLDGLRFEIEDRNATVVVEDLPTVRGVEHLLRRLFQNLLENALTYADTTAPEIRIAATRADGAWRFAVRDNGAGIDPCDLDRVFDIFTRGSNATDESGTGMGLAICKKIVDRHGGTIDIDSTLGDGTVVTFTVPDARPTDERRPSSDERTPVGSVTASGLDRA
ncbi:histidine kinase N-terminal 7TM domain-containing protein [Halosolutus amylolyticus]|uniref:histidine kinase n=1 Tax=Halosolutus amylolyticus TaxID=2932267 RepID=A0ABD5PVW1_9EURY|nr:histidine kinase N-terminal 7TM domain-containing protein [Halosolutus amylolyticus]